MRLVIQRVTSASISIEGGAPRSMGPGLVVFFAVSAFDKDSFTEDSLAKLVKKTANLRVFADKSGKMNLSALDTGLSIMVVSQFTLYADTKKGNRPSFTNAADPVFAKEVYDKYLAGLRDCGWGKFITGEFGADMKVELTNDGPVTIIIDTEEWEKAD